MTVPALAWPPGLINSMCKGVAQIDGDVLTFTSGLITSVTKAGGAGNYDCNFGRNLHRPIAIVQLTSIGTATAPWSTVGTSDPADDGILVTWRNGMTPYVDADVGGFWIWIFEIKNVWQP